MKINGNFKVRNIYQTPYPREGQQYVSEAFGKDLIAMSITAYSTKILKGEILDDMEDSTINKPENTYALVQRIMTCGKLIDVSEHEHDYIVSAVKNNGYDNFIKGQILTLMHDLKLDERAKGEGRRKEESK